jgi:hypothetical protein
MQADPVEMAAGARARGAGGLGEAVGDRLAMIESHDCLS